MSEPDALWRRLHADGHVAEPLPPAPPMASPWAARLLTAGAAWIATALLLVFFAMLLMELSFDEGSLLPTGLLLCGITAPMLRRPGGEFSRQAATVLGLTGLAMVGFGLAFGFRNDVPDAAAAAGLALVAGVLYVFSAFWVHRFMCAAVLVFALIWLIGDWQPQRLQLLQPLFAGVTVALWWSLLRIDVPRAIRSSLPPLAWPVTFAAIGLSWVAHAMHGTGEAMSPLPPMVGAALLPAVAFALTARADRQAHDFVLVAAAAALAVLWYSAPGVSLSLSLILLGFALGSPPLMGVAALSLVAGLVAYYYQLAVPLLWKSVWLGGGGALLVGLHVLLRRRAGGAA